MAVVHPFTLALFRTGHPHRYAARGWVRGRRLGRRPAIVPPLVSPPQGGWDVPGVRRHGGRRNEGGSIPASGMDGRRHPRCRPPDHDVALSRTNSTTSIAPRDSTLPSLHPSGSSRPSSHLTYGTPENRVR